MKRGLVLLSAFICLSIIATTLVSAYSPFSSFNSFQGISLSDLANSEWANAALIFLLIFSVCIFVLRDVFKNSYGAAVIVAIVMGAIGGLGIIYFYGPIIPIIAPWLLVIIIVVILLGLWRFFKGVAAMKWIALALSLLWLLYVRQNACPPTGRFSAEACQILDFLAIAILLIVVLGWLIQLAMRKAQGMSERTREPPTPPNKCILTVTIGGDGSGTTNPRPNRYPYRENTRSRRFVARPGTNSQFDHWDLDGADAGTNVTSTPVLMDADHTLTAIFTGGGNNPPKIRLHAMPVSINPGQSSKLAWTTSDATEVEITPVVGRQGPNGTFVVKPTATTTYTAIAHGPGGSATASATITVGGAPPPVIRFSAAPDTIRPGGSATLEWSTIHADKVDITPGVGTKYPNGTFVVHPTAHTTYTAVAHGPGGTTTAYAVVNVQTVNNPPRIKMVAAPDVIKPGKSSKLTWITQHTDYVIIDRGIGKQGPNDSYVVHPTDNTTYTAIAHGKGGTAQDVVTVQVQKKPPKIILSASPNPITPGQSSILSWEAWDAARVTIDPGIGVRGTKGRYPVKPARTTTYTAKAAGFGGIASAAVTVTVNALPPKVVSVNISANPLIIAEGGSSRLNWTTRNADSAMINGIGRIPLNGSRIVYPRITTVYTLIARNKQGGVATTNVRVEVRESRKALTGPEKRLALPAPDYAEQERLRAEIARTINDIRIRLHTRLQLMNRNKARGVSKPERVNNEATIGRLSREITALKQKLEMLKAKLRRISPH
jgi:hypothetical protein